MSLVFERYEVRLRGVSIGRLDATVAPGKVLCVMGPSGAGKSSLLLGAAGLLTGPFIISGRVLLFGDAILNKPAERRGVGLMFQDPLLFPHMSVVSNVMFAVPRRDTQGRRLSRSERRDRAIESLDRVALADLAGRDPATLSGGQRSRAALARTLAGAPRTLFLDEPFGALDQALRERVRQIVFDLARQDRLPVLLVSHDPEDAVAAGGEVVEITPCHRPDGA